MWCRSLEVLDPYEALIFNKKSRVDGMECKNLIYIGIDPGKSGAMAALLCWPEGTVLDVQTAVFDEMAYRDKLETLSKCPGGCVCCLEKVHAMPKQGTASTFTFGDNFGLIRGLLTAFRIPFQLVPPQKWKGEFGLNSDKQRSIDVCRRLFPEVSLRRTERCRTDDDGMAEALLMAEYARRRM